MVPSKAKSILIGLNVWYNPSPDIPRKILVMDYNTVNNIISLYIFKILNNIASHSYIHQSRYKTATVDIQRGIPEIGRPRLS